MTETLPVIDDEAFVWRINKTVLSADGRQLSLANSAQVALEGIQNIFDHFDCMNER